MRKYNHLAIDYTAEYTQARLDKAKAVIQHVCGMSNVSESEITLLLEQIKSKARVGLHFHPYRLNKDLKTVLELLIQDGQYKNQFETQISNGSLTAFKGGHRDQWENVLFGDIYASNDISLSERPKYGALDLLGHSDGPAPRFGSCYFLLKPELSQYTTFSYLDSHINPKEKGTVRYFEDILASLLAECFQRDYAIGGKNIRPHQLIQLIQQQLSSGDALFHERNPSRNLNHYIEAQVHTEIDLGRDVDVLVADASYKDTEYDLWMQQLCEKYGVALKWNKGFELMVEEVPDHFRGNKMPSIAQEVGEDGRLNAYLIGKAEREYRKKFFDQEVLAPKLQELKYLWHILVNYG